MRYMLNRYKRKIVQVRTLPICFVKSRDTRWIDATVLHTTIW